MADLPAHTSRFELAVSGVSTKLKVLRFRGEEALSRPFRYRLEIACEDPSLDFAQFVDKAAVLGILAGGPVRYVHGIIDRFEQGEPGRRFTLYQMELVPAIWRLSYRHNCRIFQQKSAPDIIKQILDEVGLSGDAYRQSLQGNHPVREYCVQYRESELAFISRLMEEEGIFYFFEHSGDRHVMVMGDSPSVHQAIPGEPGLRYVPRHAGQVSDIHIFDFRYAEAVRPGIASQRDYDFKRPAQDLTGTKRATVDLNLEVYDYPGLYTDNGVGNALTQVRLEELRVPRQGGHGQSICGQLVPGYTFELKEFPRRDRNRKYMLTSLVTEGAQPQALEETAGSGGSSFSNRFECLPADVPYRPLRVTPKPFVKGAQTAIVVGPAGEEIYTDEFGRIKVQFHWDREGQGDEKASCWMRVSQAWAGATWGAVSIPRIGHEVIVDFLEGDPDRPIVTGRVYHGTNRPPYALPEHKTRTVMKTNSSKGGDGFNEIRIEDKKGQEQIFIHAERNEDIRVKNDALEWIGHDRHLIVKHDQLEMVENEQHLLVKKDQLKQVKSDVHLTIDGDRMQLVKGAQHLTVNGDRKELIKGEHNLKSNGNHNLATGGKWSQKADGEMHAQAGGNMALAAGSSVHIKGAQTVVVEGGQGVTLKCGGSFVSVTSSGVDISGPMVKINSGGAAGSGSGCSPTSPASPSAPNPPKEAQVAADDRTGKLSTAKKAERPPAPLKYGPQAVALKLAAQQGAAFVKQCNS